MTTPLPTQASIITGEKGSNLRMYVDTMRQPGDEVLYIDEHPNTSKTSTGIYIEDIRDLQLMVRAAKPGVRTLVVFEDAAKMTTQAQNALLKLLEEPRPGLYFFLCTYTPLQLLDTIRSRCQLVTIAPPDSTPRLPDDKATRILFMSGANASEARRLAEDSRYFERRSHVFELAKRFVGGTPYDRLVVIKQSTGTREESLAFIDAALQTYTTLLKTRFSPKLHQEAAMLLEIEQAIRQNGNAKLQLLRCVV